MGDWAALALNDLDYLRPLDEGLAAARRGEHVDAEAFMSELLAEP